MKQVSNDRARCDEQNHVISHGNSEVFLVGERFSSVCSCFLLEMMELGQRNGCIDGIEKSTERKKM